ncbi:hypothetical protein ACIQPR_19000 [Streptomyces sp. NPDC091280]|uniref:hypothetical protein n=1 Tax=Streptomyces sp. NPDC091280 TaxID=3365984 RepID=UPI00381D138C
MADPRSVALQELREEAGLAIGPERLQKHHVRQVAATLCTHRAHLYSVELTGPETEKLRAAAAAHGEAADSERTYVEMARLGDIMALNSVDWSTLGAILEVLLEASRVVTGGTL